MNTQRMNIRVAMLFSAACAVSAISCRADTTGPAMREPVHLTRLQVIEKTLKPYDGTTTSGVDTQTI
jgi:hypothetical protein